MFEHRRSSREMQPSTRRSSGLGKRGGTAHLLLGGERASGPCETVLLARRAVVALALYMLFELGLPNL